MLIIDNLMEKLLLHEDKFLERKSISKKNVTPIINNSSFIIYFLD